MPSPDATLAADETARWQPVTARMGLAVWRALSGPAGPTSLDLTRFVVLRVLGLVYLVAFLTAAHQLVPLAGETGLTPVGTWLARLGGAGQGFWDVPSLFWIDHSDRALLFVAWVGVSLSALVMCGVTQAGVMLVLWALYLSIDHVGQRWYQFGWESQLLETGFIAIFLCPWRSFGPLPRRHPAPLAPILLLRWLSVRIMLGAGLIKLRGDPCWHALTCLDWHFETQPLPNPVSPLLHALPHPVLAGGVVFNHVAEMVAPWFLFGPRRARNIAAAVVLAFQLTLVVSGNLSFLNWLTIVACLACFDDGVYRRLLPRRLWARLDDPDRATTPSRATRIVTWTYAAIVGLLSLPVVLNLVGVGGQAMNRSFDRLHLVNTYGAFGSVHDERWELVIEGTHADTPDDAAEWLAYELPCKPGDPMRRPCVVSPYHYRLDWLMWFAALEVQRTGGLQREDWVVHLAWQLLDGDPEIGRLFAVDPFADRPPRWVRIDVYRYEFAPSGSGATWERERLGPLVPPIARDDPRLQALLRERGWR